MTTQENKNHDEEHELINHAGFDSLTPINENDADGESVGS